MSLTVTRGGENLSQSTSLCGGTLPVQVVRLKATGEGKPIQGPTCREGRVSPQPPVSNRRGDETRVVQDNALQMQVQRYKLREARRRVQGHTAGQRFGRRWTPCFLAPSRFMSNFAFPGRFTT